MEVILAMNKAKLAEAYRATIANADRRLQALNQALMAHTDATRVHSARRGSRRTGRLRGRSLRGSARGLGIGRPAVGRA